MAPAQPVKETDRRAELDCDGFAAAGGKATVWIVGQASGGVTTFASDSSTSSGNTLNAYDGETGRLLYQVRVRI